MTDDDLRELLWSQSFSLDADAVWQSVSALGPRRRRRARVVAVVSALGAAAAIGGGGFAAAAVFRHNDVHRATTLSGAASDCTAADITLRATPTFESSASLTGAAKVLVDTTRTCHLPSASLESQNSEGEWVAVQAEPYAAPTRPWRSLTVVVPGGPAAMFLVSWHFTPTQFPSGVAPTCQASPLRLRVEDATALLSDWCDSGGAAVIGPFVADDATSGK